MARGSCRDPAKVLGEAVCHAQEMGKWDRSAGVGRLFEPTAASAIPGIGISTGATALHHR
jgi:hypothetical protein